MEKELEDKLKNCYPQSSIASNSSNVTIKNVVIPIKQSIEKLNKIKNFKKELSNAYWPSVYLDDKFFDKEINDENESISLYAPVLKGLENDESIFSLLLKSFFYFKLRNIGKVDEIFEKIYLTDVGSQFLKTDLIKLNEAQKEKILRRIIEIIKFLEEDFKPEIKIEMLKIVISRFFEFSEQKQMLQELQLKKSLQELREIIKSPNFSLRFPTVWFPVLYQRSSFNEAIEYLEKSLSFIELDKNLGKFLWLFQIYFPRDEKVRELILNSILNLQKSSDITQKDLYFRLMENETIRNIMLKSKKESKKPIFLEKRIFYRSLIDSGRFINYSLYQLLKLGDEQESYFIWAII